MQYTGSCHCGAIKFEVEGEIESLIECNCSHCQRKGYLLFFVPRANVRLQTVEQDMATYKFNKHVIEHKFCPKCGAAPFGFGTDPKGNKSAAVNARCLENIELNGYKRIAVDGRSF